MAAITTVKGRVIEVTWDTASGNWNIVDDLPGFAKSGLLISNIRFDPSAANDELLIREGSNTGPALFRRTADGVADQREGSFPRGSRIFPYILFSEQTFTTFGDVSIIFNLL
ncbi:MAG: hypothetical protein DRP09_20825 [Candidatus Thorarchaeota archaeon]|nr:MAG: hypothetical protein DRP09_20825 [Candidatus Thorarchaeota archaeon]